MKKTIKVNYDSSIANAVEYLKNKPVNSVAVLEKKKEFKRGNIVLTVINKDFEPHFGAYAAGTINNNQPLITINIGSIIAMSAMGDIKQKDVPEVIVRTLFHEFIHVLEDWAFLDFSEKRVNRITKKYIQKAKKEARFLNPPTGKCSN